VLNALDPAALAEDHDVVELRTWLEAHEEAALLTFARRHHLTSTADPTSVLLSGEPGEVTRPFTAEELAPRLGVGPPTVQNRLALASELLTRFRAAHTQRAEGALTTSKRGPLDAGRSGHINQSNVPIREPILVQITTSVEFAVTVTKYGRSYPGGRWLRRTRRAKAKMVRT